MHRLFLVAAGLMLATPASAQPTPNSIHSVNYFADDNRVDVDSNSEPYDAIGKIYPRNCTAFVAVNPRIIVTNAHCALDDGKMISAPMYFYAAYADGKYKQKVGAHLYDVGTHTKFL
jgi:V8-like Glu-specific endopeptidase